MFSHHASVFMIGKNRVAPVLFARSLTLSVLPVLIGRSTLCFLETGDVATNWLAVHALCSVLPLPTTECLQATPSVSFAWWELRPFLFRFYCHCQFEITEYLRLFKGLKCLVHSSEFDLRISFYFVQQVELLHKTNLSFVGAKSVRPNDPDSGPSHTRCRFFTRQWCFSSCWSVMSVFPQNMQRLPMSDTFFFASRLICPSFRTANRSTDQHWWLCRTVHVCLLQQHQQLLNLYHNMI